MDAVGEIGRRERERDGYPRAEMRRAGRLVQHHPGRGAAASPSNWTVHRRRSPPARAGHRKSRPPRALSWKRGVRAVVVREPVKPASASRISAKPLSSTWDASAGASTPRTRRSATRGASRRRMRVGRRAYSQTGRRAPVCGSSARPRRAKPTTVHRHLPGWPRSKCGPPPPRRGRPAPCSRGGAGRVPSHLGGAGPQRLQEGSSAALRRSSGSSRRITVFRKSRSRADLPAPVSSRPDGARNSSQIRRTRRCSPGPEAVAAGHALQRGTRHRRARRPDGAGSPGSP